MSAKSYKYTIHYHLRKLSVEDYEIALKFLPWVCCVSKNTFKRWIYIKSNQAAEIPSNALLKMAVFFDVSPEALFSNPPTSQSIHDKLMLFFQENAAL